MASSKMIKELANNEITSDVALKRLLIIASDISNDKLTKWAEKELNGYNNNDTIPKYRIVKDFLLEYRGINGAFKVKGPLPLQALGDIDKKDLYVNIYDGINTIQNWINDKNNCPYIRDLTSLAGIVYSNTGIQCISIKQIIPENAFNDVLNNVNTILLKTLIKLDKEYGSLDNLDIDTNNKTPEENNKINTIINNILYTDSSTTIGDKNKLDNSNIVSGELKYEN